MLGHYAGNETAVRRWSDGARKPGGFSRAPERRRVLFESEYGPAVGVSTGFDLGDRQLIVTWESISGSMTLSAKEILGTYLPLRKHLRGNWTRSTRTRKSPTIQMRQPTHPRPMSSSRRASRLDP